jgi:hypothetical protein
MRDRRRPPRRRARHMVDPAPPTYTATPSLCVLLYEEIDLAVQRSDASPHHKVNLVLRWNDEQSLGLHGRDGHRNL